MSDPHIPPSTSRPWFLPSTARIIQPANIQRFATSAAPLRLRQDLQQVVQGLMPLVENVSSRSIPTSLSSAGVNANSSDIIIDMEEGHHLEHHSPQHEIQLVEAPTTTNFHSHNHTAANHNNNNTSLSNNNDNATHSPELQIFLNLCQKYLPIVFILLVKFIFDHRSGILIVVGLIITFCHSNSLVKKQVAKQNGRNLATLLAIISNLLFCICLVYLVLADSKLALALIFIPPYAMPLSLWDILWIVIVTDFIIKLITVMIKTIIVMLPSKIVAFQNKGKHYLFVESTSQLYRTIAPVQHWLYYFSDSYQGPGKVFGVFLAATYLLSKWRDVTSKTLLWKKALIGLLQSVRYGVKPSSDQLKEAGQMCPICQDDYKTPTMLHCKHVFCEECVSLWFDRERTCPMCRAEIADDPSWRDGATSQLIQFM